jgi:sterol desaturase/sphingolipid hydroxylase (fatty acid hydroxylase superfamily)
MSLFLTTVWNTICSNAAHIFGAAVIIMIAERLLPRSRYGLASRLRGAVFWIVYIAITVPSVALFNRLWTSLGIKPLISLDLSFLSGADHPILQIAGGIAAWWLACQTGEFFYYWFHRAQHKSPFLWRFHAVHHALQEMSAFNSNHHFTEEIFRIPFIVIPMSLLLDLHQGPVPLVWLLLVGAQGIYEHSETKISLGKLRYFIPDNHYHRIHHSRERHHWDKNFGSGSALWDLVFGTIHHPRKEEWPEVGLDEIGEPASLRDYLFRPFRPQRA